MIYFGMNHYCEGFFVLFFSTGIDKLSIILQSLESEHDEMRIVLNEASTSQEAIPKEVTQKPK